MDTSDLYELDDQEEAEKNAERLLRHWEDEVILVHKKNTRCLWIITLKNKKRIESTQLSPHPLGRYVIIVHKKSPRCLYSSKINETLEPRQLSVPPLGRCKNN